MNHTLTKMNHKKIPKFTNSKIANVQSELQSLSSSTDSFNLTIVIIAAPTILTNANRINVTSIGSKSAGNRNYNENKITT